MTKLLVLLISLLFYEKLALAEPITGTVVGVSDGDTITLLVSGNKTIKIRLAGIDAPEKSQAYGHQSKESLSDCAFNKTVTVDGTKLDRYQRLVAKVTSGVVDCNLRQISQGMAWHYKKYMAEQSELDQIKYADAEDIAKRNGIGLWTEKAPIAPWEYRKSRRR